jgi:hypothetical protein
MLPKFNPQGRLVRKMTIKKYGMAGWINKKVLTWLLLLSPVLYVATCSYISENKSAAFELIKVGDTKDTVIDKLGKPSHIEQSGILFSRYATHQCNDPCVERLWFENPLILGTEAWSFEIDKNDKVINNSHWVSP